MKYSADINFDGKVNFDDFIILLSQYNKNSIESSFVCYLKNGDYIMNMTEVLLTLIFLSILIFGFFILIKR